MNKEEMTYALSYLYQEYVLNKQQLQERVETFNGFKKAIASESEFCVQIIGSFACFLSLYDADLDLVILIQDHRRCIKEVDYMQEYDEMRNYDQNLILKNKQLTNNHENINEILKNHFKDIVCFKGISDIQIETKLLGLQEIENDFYNRISKRSGISKTKIKTLISLLKDSGYIITGKCFYQETPLIRLKHCSTSTIIDVSFENYTSIKITDHLIRILNSYRFLKPIIILIKKLLKNFRVAGKEACCINSISINMMVIYFFQCKGIIPPFYSTHKRLNRPSNELLQDLMEFLFFYGWIFIFNKNLVTIKNGYLTNKLYSKYEKSFVYIEDPINCSNNYAQNINKKTSENLVKVFRTTFYSLIQGNINYFF